jgi:hypothetical protein
VLDFLDSTLWKSAMCGSASKRSPCWVRLINLSMNCKCDERKDSVQIHNHLSPMTWAGKVTRWICEKIAQNLAQPTFCHIYYITLTVVIFAHILATYVINKKLSKVNNRPICRRKFALSGHPAWAAICSCLRVTETFASTSR